MTARSLKTHRQGVAAVELAFILPFIIILLLGMWEVGRMVEIQQILSNAAREGARQAATGNLTDDQVKTVVTQYLTVAGIPTTNVIVNVTDLTSGSDVSAATYLDQLQVTVSIPFQDVRWSVLSMTISPTTKLTASVTWVTMVDKAFQGFPDPPVG